MRPSREKHGPCGRMGTVTKRSAFSKVRLGQISTSLRPLRAVFRRARWADTRVHAFSGRTRCEYRTPR